MSSGYEQIGDKNNNPKSTVLFVIAMLCFLIPFVAMSITVSYLKCGSTQKVIVKFNMNTDIYINVVNISKNYYNVTCPGTIENFADGLSHSIYRTTKTLVSPLNISNNMCITYWMEYMCNSTYYEKFKTNIIEHFTKKSYMLICILNNTNGLEVRAQPKYKEWRWVNDSTIFGNYDASYVYYYPILPCPVRIVILGVTASVLILFVIILCCKFGLLGKTSVFLTIAILLFSAHIIFF